MTKFYVIDQNTGNPTELDIPLEEMTAVLTPASRSYGHSVVVATGVPAQLGTGNVVGGSVTIKALVTNSGTIYVGEDDVTPSNGFELSAGEVWLFPSKTLAELYIDASVAGDGVCYWAS